MRIHQAPMHTDPAHPLAAFMVQERVRAAYPMAPAVAYVNDIPLTREQAERAACAELAVEVLADDNPLASEVATLAAYIATGAVPE